MKLMKLNYFQLAIVWFLIGIFGKTYDDAIDMYFVQHGTLFLEFIKIILIGLGLIILLESPDIYSPFVIILLFFTGTILDYEGFLNDNYWCSISILTITIYTAVYIYINLHNYNYYKVKDILIIIIFLCISGLPMIQSCITLNGPIINYLNSSWMIKFFDITEISNKKLFFRILTITWNLILILFLEKYIFNFFNIQDENLFNICYAINYLALGYAIVSTINIYYNLYIDNIYERQKKKAERKNARAERKNARAERKNVARAERKNVARAERKNAFY